MGLGIAERIAVAGSQALIGERVDSPEHLAELAQVYRDPRYETFRVFFIKDGKVVHATGVSARLPARTPMVPAGMTEAQYLAQFREGMRRTGAQGYYILHNHPSGNPHPSPEDLELTEHLARQVPGMLAHVVINSNKYAVVTPQDAAQRAAPEAMVHLKHFGPDMLLRASKPMAALGETIQSSDALAMVGKSMQKPGWITLVGIGSDSRVRAIAEAPSNIFARSPAYLAASVRRFSRMSGSAQVFAVGDAGDINNSPVRRAVEAGILRDAVTDLGQSLAEGGRMPARRNDRAHFRDNTESANGQQPEFSNAHPTPAPVRVEMQRDGTLMVKGDPAQLQERLRQGGVDRVLRRKGGVVVGLDQVDKARQLLGSLQPAQPHNPAPSQGKLVAESYRSGYSSVNGRVQEPTQPDDGLGPTQGDARAAGDGALRRGGGAPLPHRTASLVGVGFAGRMEPADDQGSSQGILRRDGRTSLPRRTAALVGLGIAERIERSGSQSLLGEQVDSPQRLAELAQVYRDPRFETFRVFFVKDGVVVHATGVSSRMPGTAPMAPAGVSEQEYVNQMRDIKQKTGADSYYLLHNHPSGNPTPSPEDVGLTRMLGAHVPGLVAHVVINSNKYAVIDAANQGREPADMVRYQDFGEDRLLKASKPMAVLGEKMAGPDDLAIVGKSMQRPGWITLIGTGADGKVRAISEAPASILTRNYPYLAATVRRFMRQSGSGSVFAVGDAGDIGSKPVRDALAAGILRDALPDAGRTLHQQGVHTGGKGFSLTRGRRVAEGEPGSSSPSAVSMHTQRDGTLMVRGDPTQLQERLRQGGVDRALRRKGGVLVGLDQVGKARQFLLQQPSSAPAWAGAPPGPPAPPYRASNSAAAHQIKLHRPGACPPSPPPCSPCAPQWPSSPSAWACWPTASAVWWWPPRPTSRRTGSPWSARWTWARRIRAWRKVSTIPIARPSSSSPTT
ncbi:JAB domain-containing protein [Acidovorax sp. A1169]|uniref:JAB domain-containing protein n=1 Tax=Acidovorax sp. A1169 TaxID=3059524 RepID=UPI0027378E5C|nr:JAB domain-containing protein [Acidovorax sp. A1169]MDP4076844.1 JAB domain-containing protein [Acidovorax sp. A1169]